MSRNSVSTARPVRLPRLRIGLLVALCVPAGLVASPASAAGGEATAAAYEREVLAAIDAERTDRGLSPLSRWDCVDAYADRWSRFLARSGQTGHQSMLDLINGCEATRAAENLAFGDVGPAEVVAMWMQSPGHRANLLDGRLSRVGVGATRAHGRWSVVLDLARP